MKLHSTWLPKKFDLGLLAAAAVIILIGLSTIQSTVLANPTESAILSGELINKQLLALALGVGVLIALALINYEYLLYASPFFYLAALGLLGLVLVVGSHIRGAQRWIEVGPLTIQPSELSKPLLLITFASYFTLAREKINQLRWFLGGVLLLLIPSVLIYLEPDLGTMLVLFGVWLGLLYFSPLKARKLAGLIGILVILLPLTWQLLAPYQQERLISFLDPGADPLGSGYNLIQSKIAVGSGQLFGLGWGRGTQSHLQFLPEQHTDFIFATFAEEQGFFGALILLSLFAFLLWRAVSIARRAGTFLGELLAWGVVTLFAMEIFINVAMNMGLAPITGIPLPLVSYGGSALIAHLASIGLLQSIAIHRVR